MTDADLRDRIGHGKTGVSLAPMCVVTVHSHWGGYDAYFLTGGDLRDKIRNSRQGGGLGSNVFCNGK